MGAIIYFAVLFLFFKFSFEIIIRKEIQIKVQTIVVKITIVTFIGAWVVFWFVRFISEL